MSQISKVIFGSLAAFLTLGAMQFATGQEFAGRFQAVTEPTGIDVNRGTKADREANVRAATPTRTISLKVDSVTDTSVLVRVPVAKEARNLPPPRRPSRPPASPTARWGRLRADGQRADRGGQAAAAGPLHDLKFPSGRWLAHAFA